MANEVVKPSGVFRVYKKDDIIGEETNIVKVNKLCEATWPGCRLVERAQSGNYFIENADRECVGTVEWVKSFDKDDPSIPW